MICKRRSLFRILAISATIGFGACSSQANADWDTFQGDASHDGYVSGTVRTTAPEELWSTNLGLNSGDPCDLVVGSGGVFVVSSESGCALYALNQLTGGRTWTQSPSAAVASAPAYSNGMVYYETQGDGSWALHAYNATTGTAVFNASVGGQFDQYQNPVVYGGSIYTGGGGYGGEYSLNASTGAQNWFAELPQLDYWTPAVDANYCYTYVGNTLEMVNRSTGAVAAKVTNGSNVLVDTLALGSESDAVSIDNGGEFNVFSIALDATHTPHLLYSLPGSFSRAPAVVDGIIYAVESGNLVALNESNGSTLWTWNSGGILNSAVLATDNAIIVGSPNETFAISLSSHSELWSVPSGGAFSDGGAVALTDNTLYMTNDSGLVVAYAVGVPEPCSAMSRR